MPEENDSLAQPIPAAPVMSAPRIAGNPLLIPASIVIGAIIIGLFLMIGLSRGGTSTGQPAAGAAAAIPVNVKDVKTAGDPYIGSQNAPIVMVYWSDYQCPFCKAFEVGGVSGINQPAVLPTLIQKYVDTGKLKIVFKDFPFLGNDSTTAAEYEHAIWELYPTQFYAWRTAMFTAQDAEGDQGFGDAASIDQLISSKFPQMSDSKIKQQITANKAKYDAAINADKQEGSTFGISGTPGFVTGTQMIGGFEALATFTAAIDKQL